MVDQSLALQASNRTKSVSVGYAIGCVALFFCLTPWASWGTNSLDSQPWPFIFCSIYLLVSASLVKVPGSYFYILFFTLFCVTTALSLNLVSIFTMVRAVISYLTIPLAMLFFYDFSKRYGFPIKTLVSVNILWLIVGVIETLNPNLVEWASAYRTTVGRGVTSLAPEPTFFAVYLIFSSWILLILSGYKPSRKISLLVVINLLAVVFLAKSAMGIIFIPFLLLVYYINRNGIGRGGVIFLAFIILSLFAIGYFSQSISVLFSGTRVGYLFGRVNSLGIAGIVMSDASINVRVEHAVVPFLAFFENDFLPIGFSGYQDFRARVLFGNYDLFSYYVGGDKIMSWVGAQIFELGFLGVFLMLLLGWSSLNGSGRRFVDVSVLFVVLLSAVPLAFSLIPLLFASYKLVDRG